MQMTEEHKKKISLANKGRKHSLEDRKRMSNIAKEKGTGKWMKGRKMSEEQKEKRRKKQSGENHYNWQGGISSLPYSLDWTKTLRQSIRERDHYTCRLCGEKQGDRVHSVHHIDYDKNNCNPDNLITLCVKCHIKTNHNREKWIEYFNNNI